MGNWRKWQRIGRWVSGLFFTAAVGLSVDVFLGVFPLFVWITPLAAAVTYAWLKRQAKKVLL